MSTISLHNIRRFLRKTPQQRRVTARFFTALFLGKLPYAPHRVHFDVPPHDAVTFWWSHFPGIIGPGGNSIFTYVGEDIGDLRFLWRYLQTGMTFFDVGAHEGIYAVVAAKRLGPSGHVVAFEPSPRERSRLQLHLRRNSLESVDVVPCAVAAEEGNGVLVTVISGNTGRNSLLPPLTSDPLKQVKVEITTLDRYLATSHTETVDVVKIDAEGAELQIFQGADKLLKHVRPLILCEVLDVSSRPWGYPASDIISTLKACNYEWFEILASGSLIPHETRTEYSEVRNYLAVPREKIGQVAQFVSSEIQ